MAVTLASTSCPAVQSVGASIWLDDTGTNPPTSQAFSAVGQSGTADKLNRDFKASDLGHRYGAGGYAIGTGLVLTAGTGLTVNVSDGHAMIDGVVEKRSVTPVAVQASGTNWIWLKSDGTLIAQYNTTAKPTGNVVLLGAAITSGSAVTSIDTSGVVYFRGGLLWRETNDLGKPADTPDAALRFYTKSQTGLWLWDGVAYRRVDERGRAAVSFTSDANKTLSAAEYAQKLLVVTSTLSLSATRQLIAPTDIAEYQIVNSTTGGQSLTVKTASGTGVTIANAKAAVVWCDGTNVIRVTADAS